MVKMRRGDYHPFEIVVKATALILLIVTEVRCDTNRESYEDSIHKYLPKIFINDRFQRPYFPPWYKVPSTQNVKQSERDWEYRIFFPKDEEIVPLEYQNPDPMACNGQTYCEKTPYYPTEVVSRILAENEDLANFAVADSIDITGRMGPEEETPLCVSTESIIYPQSAETVDGSWLYVAQLEDKFKQGVRIETCHNATKACNVLTDLPAGFYSECKQKYIYRELQAIEKGARGEKIRPASFRFPSSCCCSIKKQTF